MYIEQIDNKNFNWFLYLPIPVFFMGIMIVNYITTADVDVNQIMEEMITRLGTNVTFALLVSPLSIACLVLLFWVKFIHGQSIRSLTTSRKKIDWRRVVFSFLLWAFFSIASFYILYEKSPENFVWNFNKKSLKQFQNKIFY